jgi:DNA-binding NarL/FixJ family response regulator
VRIVLCEDNALLREIVRETCAAAGLDVVGETDRAEVAAALAAREAADVVVLDLSSCASPGEGIGLVIELAPAAAIVAYTGLPVAELDAVAAGALAAHVPKTAPLGELVAAIERAGGA